MKIMNRMILGGAAAMLLAGCGTSSEYVDSTDTTIAVKNKTAMSSSDWVIISQQAGNAMLSSREFAEFLQDYQADAEKKLQAARAAGEQLSAREERTAKKPLLMLSDITNNTDEHIDSKLMTERLREVLFNSGKVRFTTYAAGSTQAVDAATAQARDLARDPNIKQRTALQRGKVNAYDLSLSGTIIKQTAQDGRSNELSYFFSLQLTDNETGQGVWTYTKEIKRQHLQGAFGW